MLLHLWLWVRGWLGAAAPVCWLCCRAAPGLATGCWPKLRCWLAAAAADRLLGLLPVAHPALSFPLALTVSHRVGQWQAVQAGFAQLRVGGAVGGQGTQEALLPQGRAVGVGVGSGEHVRGDGGLRGARLGL